MLLCLQVPLHSSRQRSPEILYIEKDKVVVLPPQRQGTKSFLRQREKKTERVTRHCLRQLDS